MIAAIYARKSTDQGDRADADKSVARQIEHATAYATGKGWRVDPARIYQDDGISGAEFERRPQFMRLLSDASRTPRPFDVLVVSEKSRLGREASETAYWIKKLHRAGVKIHAYLDQKELSFDTATERMVQGLLSHMDELERERASQRTHDAIAARPSWAT